MRTLGVIFVLSLLGCPPVNSTPCSDDSECKLNQRCRRGACGPLCLDDSECGDAQVCRKGTCKARPECVQDTECASGFACTDDRCQCLGDSSCGSNQQCTNGACVTRARCTRDADCVSQGGGRCEVTQGVCLPTCITSRDCAPQLDPQVALALYACIDSGCIRRCVNDVTCGGQGFICAANLCRAADCKTLADCADGQYCTSATFGRCLTFNTCSDASTCQRNWRCTRLTAQTCPPGFDCEQKLCLELPTCLTDGDCSSGVPGTPSSMQTGYCAEGHCQPSKACVSSTECGEGKTCISRACVPKVCRGAADCTAGQACVDGACVTGPTPAQINVLRITPSAATVIAGSSFRFQLIAFRLDGSSFPLADGAYSVVDEAGMPTTTATITGDGVFVASMPGRFSVRGAVTGSALAPVEAAVLVLPNSMGVHRVVVVDAATQTPVVNAKVWGCEDAACTSAPVEAVTDVNGAATFAGFGAGKHTYTIVTSEIRSDGLPRYERASIIGTSAVDLYLPLRDNPIRTAAGFNGSLSFTRVSTNGTYWAGLVATSFDDVISMKPGDLLGDTFSVQLDTINQRIPVPGAVVLYTSPAFGFPQEVNPRSLGFSQPGTRARWKCGYSTRPAAIVT